MVVCIRQKKNGLECVDRIPSPENVRKEVENSTDNVKTIYNIKGGYAIGRNHLWVRDRPDNGVYSLSSRIFIISQAALATDVPGPKIAATPAL